MSKRRLGGTKVSHTTRNILIAAILIAISAIGVAATGALNGFLNPQPTSFPVIIHVYDAALASSPDAVTGPEQLVANVTITVEGPLNITQFTQTGVLAGGPLAGAPIGTYHVTASRDGYSTSSLQYAIRAVGPNCDRQDSVGNCHIWIAMSKSP